MQCYTELFPPTGVTHALKIPFISATANNLVVARTSVLQFFSLINIEERSSQPGQETSKLSLEKEYSLPGIVTDICRVKLLNTKSGGEAILLSFRNAKLSLIEWDPERHGISTISIHYYERDDLTRSPWVPDLNSCGSILSVDPSSRCAVFNFGVRNLAILPFHQPGDDLVMDDYNPDFDDEKQIDIGLKSGTEDEKALANLSHQTPYAPSFVLPLTALDPSILHPISLAFLYEYREPTFGILYSQVATSSALIHERKDVVVYTVFTLDLEQRASTTLLSVFRLPSDLFKVVALPPPVGGALLIGANELVHVDQAGKTNAVGLNEFSRQVSTFSMTDQSDLALRLEECVVERLGDNGDLLLVLSTGNLALIKFKLDGRSVSGISVHCVPAHAGGRVMGSSASTSAYLGDGRAFFGSEDADSILLGWSSSPLNAKKPRSHAKNILDDSGVSSEDEQSEDDACEDDLYSSAPSRALDSRRPSEESSAFGFYHFRIHDALLNIGPIRDFTMGKPQDHPQRKDSHVDSWSADLELVVSHGSGESGGLLVMKREIDPYVLASMAVDQAKGVWTASISQTRKGVPDIKDIADKQHYVIISTPNGSDREISKVFLLEEQTLKPFKAPDFNANEDVTIGIGELTNANRVVQILKNEVRTYDSGLELAQIYPVWDEDTSDERVAVSVSLVASYLAILRDDSTLLLLQADHSGDLDEIGLNNELAASQWISCSLYQDKTGFFSSIDLDMGNAAESNIYLFLLGIDYRLFMYRMPDQKLIALVEGVDCLAPILSNEPPKRSTMRESFVEAVVADLGDSSDCSPYLLLRAQNGGLTIYRPFFAPTNPNEGINGLRFLKEASHSLPRIVEDTNECDKKLRKHNPLRILPDVSGLSAIFVPGHSAGFVCKTSASSPHFVRLRGESIQSLSALDPSWCSKGFIYLDSKNVVRLCQLPHESKFEYPWVLRKVSVGEQVDYLTYSSASRAYVLGTSQNAEFKLPDDDELHPEWRNEVISFPPEVPTSSLKVIEPGTWSIVDSYILGCAEHITAVKTMSLEVSENTHERREMIVVGTASARGEDIPSRGCVYVFEVIKVVADPEHPEANRRLKLIGKEPVKGAVTALCEIGSQGFLMVGQGQKCMVRGLKEDGSLLPVAFMDIQCYASVIKELKGTGMCILGDAVKGLWFAGYSEEPYKMSLFSKDLDYLDVLAADFLPDENKLFVVVADSGCNLHVLQYDPEDPKSSNGDKLLARSKFHMGSFATTVNLLPRTIVSSERMIYGSDDMDLDIQIPQYQVLITSESGSLGLVTCVSEESYRRLSALQSQLTNSLEHPCGLNPRAFRAVESDGTVGRGMLDGNLLSQWLDMSKQRMTEIANRVGANEWEIKTDLAAISGGGLGYL